MRAYLRVAVKEGEGSTVLHVDGELDLASAGRLEHVLSRVPRTSDLTVIDLDKLRFLDMAGFRVLLSAHQEAEREGRRLVLANVRDPIRRVLRLARVDGLLPVLEG